MATAQLGIGGSSSPMMNMPQITSLDVQCEKSGMTVDIEFSQPFDGIIFSKGHFSNDACRLVIHYIYIFMLSCNIYASLYDAALIFK